MSSGNRQEQKSAVIHREGFAQTELIKLISQFYGLHLQKLGITGVVSKGLAPPKGAVTTPVQPVG